jgi:hypothetical protein
MTTVLVTARAGIDAARACDIARRTMATNTTATPRTPGAAAAGEGAPFRVGQELDELLRAFGARASGRLG